MNAASRFSSPRSRVSRSVRCVMLAALLVGAISQPVFVLAREAEPRIEPDVVYGHKDGLALTLDVYHPPGKANGAAILFMVSGGWFSRWAPPENSLPLFQPYLDAGYTMLAVRHGSSPRYSIPEAIGDVRRAVRFTRRHARRFGIDPERLGVMGMSAGGHLALMLGTTGEDGGGAGKRNADGGERRGEDLNGESSRVAAVVSLVPPTDLRVAVWDAPESLPAYRNYPALNLPLPQAGANSPLTHVTPDDAPALVIMGGEDKLVPPRHGQWIAEAFEEHKVPHKLIILPGAGHGLAGQENRTRVREESLRWFDKHLRVAAEGNP